MAPPKPLKLLVVEDVDEMRIFLEAVLGERLPGEPEPAFLVSSLAGGGAEARAAWARERPDGVLLDEVLPGESALDLLDALSADGLPVLLLTSVEAPEHALPARARGRVVKPAASARPSERRAFRDAIRKAFLT